MTDNTSANVINNMLRTLSTWILDFPAYWLLKIMYKIFFNVSTAELFTSATIKNFYSRVQLIIGVFMVFKLAVTILEGIVNPDKFTDKKAGFSSVITRIITSLIMLTLLVPINIPNAKNEYEKQLNNNGLLFGTLYSLQYRLLNNNTLGRLILGTTDNATTGATDDATTDDDKKFNADTQAAQLEKSANIFTTTILKGFIRINLVEENADETKSSNWVCQNVDENILEIYTNLDADPKDILGLVNVKCSESEQSSNFLDSLWHKVKGIFKELGGSERYMFAYIPILPAIVGYVFVFILLGFTVDIAVRAVKLAVLRLIAPIPIISYIEPKQAKDGAFAAWCRTLVSTYLDLFLRLAIVYFVIFLIQDMIVNGIIINNGSGMIGILSSIFIWIGLFFFAKQAPKFIKDVLGIKGSMQNIGLSAILGGTASLLGGGGAKGFALGAMQGAKGSVDAYNSGKTFSPTQSWSQNRDMMAKIRTGDKDAQGGIEGRMMDRLNYGVRERMAGKLGLSSKDVAQAEYIADLRKSEAAEAKVKLDHATQNLNNLSPDATPAEREEATNLYRQAYAANEAAQKAYGKAQKTYESMDKDRGNMGVGPRILDTKKETYRSAKTIRTEKIKKEVEGVNIDYNVAINKSGSITDKESEFIYDKDIKNFAGTKDDSTFSSSGHGSGGPGGPAGMPPR